MAHVAVLPLVCGLLLAPFALCAQEADAVNAPRLAAQDQWTMRRVDLWTGREVQRVRSEVARVDERSATLLRTALSAEAGAPTPAKTVTLDLRTLTFDEPERSASSLDFAFPLTVGKKWTAEFKTPSGNPNYQVPHTRSAHVEGWETVAVPAGTFKALRISYVDRVMLFIGDGIFPAYINETRWYAPEVKWYVKREEVVRNPLKKIETQVREELVDFKLAP